jgi:hypothetical protein
VDALDAVLEDGQLARVAWVRDVIERDAADPAGFAGLEADGGRTRRTVPSRRMRPKELGRFSTALGETVDSMAAPLPRRTSTAAG